MYIQYAGFDLASDFRTYNFHVIDPPEEAREFTVNLPDETFRTPPFKTQDGPAICMVRLKKELEQETRESPARASLNIARNDIREYIEKNYPKPVRKWGVSAKSRDTGF